MHCCCFQVLHFNILFHWDVKLQRSLTQLETRRKVNRKMQWPCQNHIHTNFIPSAPEISFSTFPNFSTLFLFCQHFSLLGQPIHWHFWSLRDPTQSVAIGTIWMGSSLWSSTYLFQVDCDFVWFYLCLFHQGYLLQLWRETRDELG